MTAEIAVLNKSAVALAADSAVSIPVGGGHKIFNTTNKLFALTKHHPVGIMVYGAAELNGVPWETLIKIYRKQLNTRSHPTIEDYRKDFFNFLSSDATAMLQEGEAEYFGRRVLDYLFSLRARFLKKVDSTFEKESEVAVKKTRAILTEILKGESERFRTTRRHPAFTRAKIKTLANRRRKEIDHYCKNTFEGFELTKSQRSNLYQIIGYLFSREEPDENELSSGVVFAGFGEDEHYPVFEHIRVQGYISEVLSHKVVHHNAVTSDTPVFIHPLAQSEVVATFMEGIDPQFRSEIGNYMESILVNLPEIIVGEINKTGAKVPAAVVRRLKKKGVEMHREITESLMQHSDANHIQPVVNATIALPKDELAAMAESLVNLTSFRRKVSMDAETVGGAIDVAVISKGDGFVWIKRKHYFKPELNPQFFKR